MLSKDYFGTLSLHTLWIHVARRSPRILSARDLYVYMSIPSFTDSSETLSFSEPRKSFEMHLTAFPDTERV